jgi:hypothetical protein
VRAAATLPWSTGPVEGRINRLVWGLSCQVWRVVPCLLFDLMA